MASVREIKRRISSVKNIGQVTRALEAVSASKARRAQKQAESSRDYTQGAWEVLVNLSGQPGGIEHPLMTVHDRVDTILMVLLTSDRGLAGAYNLNIIRVAEDFIARHAPDANIKWVSVGRKGRDHLVRRNRDIIAEFSDLPAEVGIRDVVPIGDIIVDEFLKGSVQQVFVAYTDFVNVMAQRPRVINLLPLKPYEAMVASDYFKAEPAQTVTNREYIYEPQASMIVDTIVPRFNALQIYQAILEAVASEHSARMVAMQNASKNADELVDSLTLEYNKARQTAITSEILDIVGGVEALGDEAKKTVKKSLQNSGMDVDFLQSHAAEIVAQAKSVGDNVVAAADEFIQDAQQQLEDYAEDDLTRIEGIGKMISQALIENGLRTFRDIANTSAAELERIVKEVAKVRMVGDAATWAKQAKFIVQGDLDGLKAYQDRLVGGREPDA